MTSRLEPDRVTKGKAVHKKRCSSEGQGLMSPFSMHVWLVKADILFLLQTQ